MEMKSITAIQFFVVVVFVKQQRIVLYVFFCLQNSYYSIVYVFWFRCNIMHLTDIVS